MPRRFGRTGDVHSRIAARIQQILEEETIYPFLGPEAGQYLRDIRKKWKSVPSRGAMILPDGPESFWFCPWSGSRETETLRRLLTIGMMKKYYGPDKEEAADQKETSGENPAALYPVRVDGDRLVLHIRTDRGIQRYQDQAADFAAELDPEDPSLVLEKDEAPECDKYDFMVPPALLRSAFLHNQLSMADAVEILCSLRKVRS
jgi:ATP-dependent Lhr-like helicase